MLAYSGKGQFVIETIDLNIFIEEMAYLVDVSISKNIELKYHFADNLPTFDGDATQVRQIIMNLILNASDAIGRESGSISLVTGVMHCDRAYLDEISRTLDSGDLVNEGTYAYFEVTDTGVGMDAATLERIFDPFFTTKANGRGLGIAGVHGIVRGHRGAIRISSELGTGTTFKVLFPVNESNESEPANIDHGGLTVHDWRGSGTLLIVDDEETVRTVSKAMVGHMEFQVLTAADGSEAISILRQHTDEIVCVLLDLYMPNMDGEQAFHEIVKIKPDIKIILSSGINLLDTAISLVGKRPDGYLQKPYDLEKLKQVLMTTLDGESIAADDF
ncbi:MAG: hypothetical protein CMQ20_15980 [Gammaproteobacteria bacterium]|jgi:CheY-like chemotaxis protein|nr:hypothetical protein [Gammaproteobacteria bacterium]|tara:strand:+ start:192 stop:1184 length:993 start_codon:yes stop_codon:yes gene_type:complete